MNLTKGKICKFLSKEKQTRKKFINLNKKTHINTCKYNKCKNINLKNKTLKK